MGSKFLVAKLPWFLSRESEWQDRKQELGRWVQPGRRGMERALPEGVGKQVLGQHCKPVMSVDRLWCQAAKDSLAQRSVTQAKSVGADNKQVVI